MVHVLNQKCTNTSLLLAAINKKPFFRFNFFVVICVGKVGITLNVEWKEPKTVNDTEAARRSVEFMVGWFAHPIYVNGDYSDIMRKQVDMKSKAQGLTRSRLPVFTDAEKKSIQGEHDRNK